MRFIVFLLCLYCTTITANEELVICTWDEDNKVECVGGPPNQYFKYCLQSDDDKIRVCSNEPIQIVMV